MPQVLAVGDPPRRDLALLDRVDDLGALADAVAAGEKPGHRRGAGCRVHNDLAARDLESLDRPKEVVERLLAEGLDHHVAVEPKVSAGDRHQLRRTTSAPHLETLQIQSADGAVPVLDRDGCDQPFESHPAGLCELDFVLVGRHVSGGAPVGDDDPLGAEPGGSVGGVDGGVAAADDNDTAADLALVQGYSVGLVDEIEGLPDALQIFTRDVELRRGAETDAEEDRVVVAEQTGDFFAVDR